MVRLRQTAILPETYISRRVLRRATRQQFIFEIKLQIHGGEDNIMATSPIGATPKSYSVLDYMKGGGSAPPGEGFLDYQKAGTIPGAGSEGMADVKGRLESLYDSIGSAYNDLVKRGRESDAFALKDAAERFAATGSRLGVNSFARARELTNLKNAMGVATRGVEAKLVAQKLSQQAQALGQLEGITGNMFNQAMQVAKFKQSEMENIRANAPIRQTSPIAQERARQQIRRSPATPRRQIAGQDMTAESKALADTMARTRYYEEAQRVNEASPLSAVTRPMDPYVRAQQDVRRLWSTPTGVAVPQALLYKGNGEEGEGGQGEAGEGGQGGGSPIQGQVQDRVVSRRGEGTTSKWSPVGQAKASPIAQTAAGRIPDYPRVKDPLREMANKAMRKRNPLYGVPSF